MDRRHSRLASGDDDSAARGRESAPRDHLVPLADSRRPVRAVSVCQARHLGVPPDARHHDRPGAGWRLDRRDRKLRLGRHPAGETGSA